MRVSNVLIAWFMMLTAGCASIVTDSTQDVRIESRPDVARVSVTDQSGRQVSGGVTPMSVTLDKAAGYFDGQRYEVTLAKEGFAERTVVLRARPNGWYIAGNLVFGGFIGWLVVDPLTGAMYTLSPEEVSADLRARSAAAGDLRLEVVLLREVPAERRAALRPIGP